jgi:hypothetical protein
MSRGAGLPLISVVVRSMDRPSLPATLDSIAVQGWRPREIVLVNARGPGHRVLPQTWQGIPIRATSAGSGHLRRSAAANAGLDAATGDAVIFLDDDDLFLPEHLLKLAEALRARPDAVAAHTGVSLGQDGPQGWLEQHVFDDPFDRLRLRLENYLPMHAVLIHSAHSAAVAACRFDESLDLFEDWDFWLQLAAFGDFVDVPGVSARYVVASDGGSGVFAESAAAQDARLRLFAKWRNRGSDEDHAALMLKARADFREARQARAELAGAREAQVGLEAMLQARDEEIVAHAHELAGLQQILMAREADTAAAIAQCDGLRAMLVARDEQIAHLEPTLTAREVQIANLEPILAAREIEIGNFRSALKAAEAELARLRNESPLQALRRSLKPPHR